MPQLKERLRRGDGLRQAGGMVDGTPGEVSVDLTVEHLDVYDTHHGPWNPDHGDVEIPESWEFLPTGDAFVTRTVKSTGKYWLCWQPRSKHRSHRRLLGLWAPTEAVAAARRRAIETAEKRAKARQGAAGTRVRDNVRYEQQLRDAVVAYLDFAPPHAELASQVAAETARHAAVVGSGRVGRTQLLTLEEKAALAARAHIRHSHTAYEDELDKIPTEAWDEDDLYREIKGAAHDAVNDFLDQHRRR
jgi:Uncharacterized conserved protein (DUF2293)